MKKLILLLTGILLMTGCGTSKLLNTPTKKVEMFFGKYQSLDEDVVKQLEEVSSSEMIFNEEQKKQYIDIMKKHYKNIKYDVKDEKIDGSTATVTVEIDVKDYSKIMEEADTYLEEHPSEFEKDGEYNESLFTDYRLKKLKEAKDRVKYTVELTLTKIDDEWVLDDIDSVTEKKIQGIYDYQ